MPIEDAGQPHARKRDGRLHRESQREREHVAVLAGPGTVDGSREAVVRVQEDGQGSRFEGGPDGFEGRVVEACGEAGGAEDDAADVRVGGGGDAADLGHDGRGGGGEREGGEGVEAVPGRRADGFEFVVDGSRPRCALFRAQKVEPGVRERDDGRRDAVRVHEAELLVYGRVGGVDGPAALVRRERRVVVGWEDDEARRGRGVGEVEEGSRGFGWPRLVWWPCFFFFFLKG